MKIGNTFIFGAILGSVTLGKNEPSSIGFVGQAFSALHGSSRILNSPLSIGKRSGLFMTSKLVNHFILGSETL